MKKTTKEKFVTTIQNKKLPISKTRPFNKKYYEIGNNLVENSGDCYLMEDGKYYRIETGHIVYNVSQKKYVFASSLNLAKGIVNSDLEEGYFDYDLENNIEMVLENSSTRLGLSKDIVENNLQFRECINTGVYFHISQRKALELLQKETPRAELKNSLDYNSKNSLSTSIKEFEKHFKFQKDTFNTLLGNAVEPFTFGLEFETVKGNVPMSVCKRLGLIPLRDGSITGLEYATIPHSGIRGIAALKESIEVLKKYTEYDKDCSIHIHMGGIPRTESFITAFFKTTLIIQNQLYEMFPLYKKENYGYKKKNYTAPYEPVPFLLKMDNVINDSNLIKNFGIIFEYLSNGIKYEEYGCSLNNVKSHPKDQEDNHKWYVNTRYHLHNIIPLIFGNKQTIEFRLHTSTFEDFKIFNFLLLNAAILKFVVNNEKKILKNRINFEKLNLFEILRNSFGSHSKLYEDIIFYFDCRRKKIRDEYCIKNNFFFDEDSLKIQNPFRRYDKNKYLPKEQKTNFLNDFSNFLILQRKNQRFSSFDASFSKKPSYTHVFDKSTGAIKIIDSNTGFDVVQGSHGTDSYNKPKKSKLKNRSISNIGFAKHLEEQRIYHETSKKLSISEKEWMEKRKNVESNFFTNSQKDDLSEVVDRLINKCQKTGVVEYVDPVDNNKGIVEQMEDKNNMDF